MERRGKRREDRNGQGASPRPAGPRPAGPGDAGFSADRARDLWEETSRRDSDLGATLKSDASSPVLVSTASRRIVMAGRDREGAPDFRLGELLGVGGMGAVFAAEQCSLAREVAVKVIKPELAGKASVAEKFVSEAIVTGRLEHPHIVPVHQLGRGGDGTLFYAMKRVRGTSWDEVLRKKSEAENLDVLLRVCDAVAFAHDSGFLHRDLKPENVMLGDFGEVLVLDWGLAVPLDEEGRAAGLQGPAARAGTPAYMAPEMARCEGGRIGMWSDIYLLGGILYEIATGLKPHAAENVFACIHAAARNEIQPSERDDELAGIARAAMASEPEDRYGHVAEFRDAILACRAHDASREFARGAFDDLERAGRSASYEDFSQAAFGFREALRLWPENREAQRGLAEARLAQARLAHARGDLDLSASLLDPDHPLHRRLGETVEKDRAARAGRQRRLKALALASGLLGLALLAVLSVALLRVRDERRTAVRAAEEALAAERRAKEEEQNAARTFARAQEEENAALATLRQLEGERRTSASVKARAAPAFLAMAERALQKWDLESAARHASVAAGYDPGLARAFLLQAAILAGRGRHAEAIEKLGGAGGAEGAGELGELCRAALQAGGAPVPVPAALSAWFFRNGFPALADPRSLAVQDQVAWIRSKLHAVWPVVDATVAQSGDTPPRITLTVIAPELEEIAPLAGLPLHHLDLANTRVRDLRPLAGLPLSTLGIGGTPVQDLSPLQGAPLEELSAPGTKVADLRPLAGMKLRQIDLSRTPVTDLSPLRGMPLRFFVARDTGIRDLAPVCSRALEGLDVARSPVADASPLREAPSLAWVDLSGSEVADLGPLASLHATSVSVARTPVRSLDPLKGVPVASLNVEGTPVQDFSVLRDLPLREINLARTGFGDLELLRGKAIALLDLSGTVVRDFLPLKDHPLRSLLVCDTSFDDPGLLKGKAIAVLWMDNTPVRDLAPLRDLPLVNLHIAGTPVSDLRPLRDLKLVDLKFSPDRIREGLEVLRAMKSLRTVNELPTRAFWEKHDKTK
jgi:hypothetical protein